MPIRRLEELHAYRLAVEFKLGVYAVVRGCEAAQRDHRYCSQLFDAASSVEANIAEGWKRFAPREMSQFLRYALASLEEAKKRLADGAHRGYFPEARCSDALTTANRCGAATMALWKSLQRFVNEPKHRGLDRNVPRRPPAQRPRSRKSPSQDP